MFQRDVPCENAGHSAWRFNVRVHPSELGDLTRDLNEPPCA
jgi:hypothetical protein